MKKNRLIKLFLILFLIMAISMPIYFSLAEETEEINEEVNELLASEETENVMLISTEDVETSFTAFLYETSSYATGGSGTELTSSGTEIEAWEYDTSKYLQINTTVPDDGNTYVIQVKTPQEFYIVSNNLTAPSGFSSVEFTKNDDITVNGGSGTYEVNTYSGTAEFTIDAGITTSTLQLQITYDTVLWNKLGNSLLTEEGVYPLEVVLCQKSSDGNLAEIKDLYVSKAYSGSSWSFAGLNYFHYLQNGSSTSSYNAISMMSDATAELRPLLYTSTQAHFNYYFENLKLEISIPYYQASDGAKYYLDYDISNLTIYNDAEFEIDESLAETEHKIIVLIKNFYWYSSNRIFANGIIFSFPDRFSCRFDCFDFYFPKW